MILHTRRLWAAAVALSATVSAAGQDMARPNVGSRPSAAKPSNQHVANMIAQRLHDCPELKRFSIDVTFENGIADLGGAVADEEQRMFVIRMVHGVPGVNYVRDHMSTVAPKVHVVNMVMQEPAPAPTPAPMQPAMPPTGTTSPMPPGAMPNSTGPISDPAPIMQGPPPNYYDVNPPKMPPHAWPTYAPYNNYSRVAHPQLYPYNAWPYVGPNYPFPKVPPGWRKIQLEWQDGYWWYATRGSSHDWWVLRYW